MPRGGKREGAGRKAGRIQLDNRTINDLRAKIKTTWLLNKLEAHIGKPEGTMSPSAVTAAIALLKKVIPDLAAVEHSGAVDIRSAGIMNDAEVDAELAIYRATRSEATSAPDSDKLH